MFNSLFDGAPVDIMQMLDARERRAHTQQQLLEQFNPCVLVSITLNIPGPVKNSEAITTVFASVISELDEALMPFEKLLASDRDGVLPSPSRRRTSCQARLYGV